MPPSSNTTARSVGAGIPNTATLTEKFRRNGKLQSCESCRKSKLRCDHVVPACGRCVKRGKASQCFYHPNPLTQQTPVCSVCFNSVADRVTNLVSSKVRPRCPRAPGRLGQAAAPRCCQQSSPGWFYQRQFVHIIRGAYRRSAF